MREVRNLIALTFTDSTDPLREVDVLVATAHDAESIVSRAETYDWHGVEVRVASRTDLIGMKTGTGRMQDEADCALLKKLEAP